MMRLRRHRMDVVEFLRVTSDSLHRGEEVLAAAKAYEFDTDRVARLKLRECRTCYYLRRGQVWSRVGGAAMTAWNCGVCMTEQTAGSTNTDKVCQPCSLEHSLCRYCGGDAEMRERRRKWPTEEP